MKSKTITIYQSRANRLFSLPWNYPNKWTVPLSFQYQVKKVPINPIFYWKFLGTKTNKFFKSFSSKSILPLLRLPSVCLIFLCLELKSSHLYSPNLSSYPRNKKQNFNNYFVQKFMFSAVFRIHIILIWIRIWIRGNFWFCESDFPY